MQEKENLEEILKSLFVFFPPFGVELRVFVVAFHLRFFGVLLVLSVFSLLLLLVFFSPLLFEPSFLLLVFGVLLVLFVFFPLLLLVFFSPLLCEPSFPPRAFGVLPLDVVSLQDGVVLLRDVRPQEQLQLRLLGVFFLPFGVELRVFVVAFRLRFFGVLLVLSVFSLLLLPCAVFQAPFFRALPPFLHDLCDGNDQFENDVMLFERECEMKEMRNLLRFFVAFPSP